MKTKKALIILTIPAIILQGCAQMQPYMNNVQEYAKKNPIIFGGGAGAAGGAAIGAMIDGKNGALWGGLAGLATGLLAGYVLSQDQFTQTSTQTSQTLQNELNASKPEDKDVTVSEVGSNANGQKIAKVDEMNIEIPQNNMEENKRLSKKAKNVLKDTVKKTKKAGGTVTVFCPESAPLAVVKELKKTGAKVMKEDTPNNCYQLKVTRVAV